MVRQSGQLCDWCNSGWEMQSMGDVQLQCGARYVVSGN